ncbi:MAG: ABC transporter ATP-binding protein [Planctomycetales bacterium]|nr:ABC transporter ATP-binding protein [Planctomycetales bacterium]
MTTAQATITVNDLHKTFRALRRSQRVTALRGVSFEVERGAIFGLLGPNGAGKTTLIKVLLGLVRPSAGGAHLFGLPVGNRTARQRIGYLPEHHRIPRHHTGRSALYYYGGLSGLSPSDVRRREADLLKRVGLHGWGNTSVSKYSKGMLQRLGLAQAMLHDPDLLILDEPTDGVDPVGRREMRAILRDLRHEGKTIFINSHLLQEVELICDRAAVLVRGELRRVGPVQELTQLEQTDVEFTVHGPVAMVRTALEATTPALAESTIVSGNSQLCNFVLSATSPAQLNHCVDQLRRLSLDIVSIVPKRHSLEDAFVRIVSDERTDTTDSKE